MAVRRIYLDCNASTPIDPAVVAAMKPFLEDHYGNPSSGHWAATTAKAALEASRSQVAALLGCHNDEVVYTGGGSEANNVALKGVFFALRDKGDHIVTTRIEHPAIIEPCRFLERLGARVTYLPVDGAGRVDPDGLRRAITHHAGTSRSRRSRRPRRSADARCRALSAVRNRGEAPCPDLSVVRSKNDVRIGVHCHLGDEVQPSWG